MIVDDLRVNVTLTGSGPPVLLLHGWGRSHEDFAPIAERLSAEGFACYALDLPGFGNSAMPPAASAGKNFCRR